MPLIPLQQWVCDHCGNVIQHAEQGYFEWKKNDEELNYGFRIVHFKTCQYNERTFANDEHIQDLQLEEFIGEVGLVRIFHLLQTRKFKDQNELIETLYRLQISYYEESRLYMNQALQDGFAEPGDPRYYRFPENAQRIVERYSRF